MQTDRKIMVEFSEATAATFAAIAAQGVGTHIEIDQVVLNPDGGVNTITLDFGAIAPVFVLDDAQALVLDAPDKNPYQVDHNTAFNITLSAATAVSGFIMARVVGEN